MSGPHRRWTAHERRGERHRPHPAHRDRPRRRPLLGEALPIPPDEDAHQGRRDRVLHREPHRRPRAGRRRRARPRRVRPASRRAPPPLLSCPRARGRRRDPSLRRRRAARAHRAPAGGGGLRAGLLLGALRGPRRDPRRGEPRSGEGSPRPRGSARTGRRGTGGRHRRERPSLMEATLNYVAAMAERPFFFQYEPPPGTPWRNTKGDRRTMTIGDARRLDPPPSLDREGFALVRHRTAVADLWAEQAPYYREVEALVRAATG